MPSPTPQVTRYRPAGTSDYGSDIDLRSLPALSDYGSDFDPKDIDEDPVAEGLLTQLVDSASKRVILPSTGFDEGERENEDEYEHGSVEIHGRGARSTIPRIAKTRSCTVRNSPVRPEVDREGFISRLRGQRSAPVEVEYDIKSQRVWSISLEEQGSEVEPVSTQQPSTLHRSDSEPSANIVPSQIRSAVSQGEHDYLTPLERFRTKPKKPLSVTDLVSPAWCELQYLYTLSKFGRKPHTQAMRTGSRIHATLEAQVHDIIPVRTKSKEDKFGLRIWNTIAGLRCLRGSGLTRELEVWGVLEGQVINGVIDEVSFTCPDPDFERQLKLSKSEKSGGAASLPPGQLSISQAFANASQMRTGDVAKEDMSAWINTLESERQVYIADVKTRSVRSVPTGASLRPTWMQLMLYRTLLESLSLNTVDAETVFSRYELRPLESFTDVFLQEMGGMRHFEDTAMEDDGRKSGDVDVMEITQHPNLLSLWSLMITEFQRTLSCSILSPILRAEFRYSRTGDIIGSELIVYDADVIDRYVKSEMGWWKGDREAKGVEIEEAFKCRVCDFAEDCSWRKAKIEEATEKNRLRRTKESKSAV